MAKFCFDWLNKGWSWSDRTEEGREGEDPVGVGKHNRVDGV